ncbi:testis-specific serine/threonine-protein kinase 2-like [Podarcis raffonei]|uniref:testis-specific serine/threonine-protein kinase 2-like n=1 Tax=Podarcis raffonei TaxID=65483 RepID=UPI002329742E|nr:testis-specific serine/threonine-protein kinase 2-like [Podarcis raffonei]
MTNNGIPSKWLEEYANNVTKLIFASAYSMMDDAAILKKRGYIMGGNLGEGSYAKVKSAFSERLKFDVAVKIIDRKKAPLDFLERFLPREIDILAKVNHRSIIKTYEIFETSDGKVYIVMELGVQGDLLEFIKSKGAMPEDIARKMFRQLCAAIKYCHDSDIVHRDLKCENLLLDKDYHIKLSDFGFSKRLTRDEDGKIIHSKTFCGSAAYAAPEVLQGIPYEPKIYDMWSLGVILYIMVCGSMPYDDSNIRKMLRLQKEHRVHFPKSKNLTMECKDLIYRMLQPDVARRLHIDDVLSHVWMQPPKPKCVSTTSVMKNGESSRTECDHKPNHKSEVQVSGKSESKQAGHSRLEVAEGVGKLGEIVKPDNLADDVVLPQFENTEI